MRNQRIRNQFDLMGTLARQLLAGLIVSVFGIIMTGVNIYTNNLTLSYSSLALSVLGIVYTLTIYFGKMQVHGMCTCILYCAFSVICVSHLVHGSMEAASVLWFVLLPIFTYLMFELNVGAILNICVFVLICIIFWSPFHSYLFGYSAPFEMRFPIIYFTEIVLVTILEWVRTHSVRKYQEANQTLEMLVTTDLLTGAYTYYGMEEKIKQVLAQENYSGGYLVVLNIAGFKLINDGFGYKFGNEILKGIAEYLARQFKENEMVARVASDHFFLLLEDESRDKITIRLTKYIEEIKRLSRSVRVDVEFGVVKFHADREENGLFEKLYTEALLALDTIRKSQAVHIAFYEEQLKRKAVNEKELAEAIEQGFQNHEFYAYLQPKYSLEKEEYCGAEALIRWKKKDGKLIGPGEFIPFMEESGMVMRADFEMLQMVCAMQKTWEETGRKLLPISVNFSQLNLLNEYFSNDIKHIVDSFQLPHDCIAIELTESETNGKLNVLKQTVSRLQKDGFSVHMDDFGTGYSSFGMLKDVDVDVVKMDKSLFDMDASGKMNEEIIKSLIALCHSLKKKVVAEGIEEEKQTRILKALGCDIIQGYYYGKPMDAKEFEQFIYETC